MEEAIEEAEKRAISYIEPDISLTAAGQEPDEDLDEEWERIKNIIDMHVQNMTAETTKLGQKLSRIPFAYLRDVRRDLINMAALIEKELLRRGEEF